MCVYFSLIQYTLKTFFGFSVSLACHVPFLFSPLRSLRGNWCCLFIIQGLNGTTIKICHSLSVMIALFHYQPSAEGSQAKSSNTTIGTFHFLLPDSWVSHESLTNQLVTSYLLLFQHVMPLRRWDIVSKTDIKYTWTCLDENWDHYLGHTVEDVRAKKVCGGRNHTRRTLKLKSMSTHVFRISVWKIFGKYCFSFLSEC